eukprot:scaffold361144_cov43-Prasinocladus_malaysianus.AAC.1
MANLERFIDRDSKQFEAWRPSPERIERKLSARTSQRHIQSSSDPIDIEKFMGKWNVLANIPIGPLNEQNFYNPVENYHWDPKHKRVEIVY